MSETINYSIKFDSNGNAVLDKIASASTNVQKSISRTQAVCDKFGASFLKLEGVKRAIDGVGQAFNNIMQPGLVAESSMADLSAITGLTGEKLNEIEAYARKASKTFGGGAAKSIETYKLILSQLGPEIAKTPTALQAMGNSVATLSKTMGGDSVAATEVLTTAMNQFQVSLADPTQASKTMAEMMNVMAAAAKEGSAELPAIKMALEQSGMAAKMAGVSFSETNAAIQVLDKAGKKASEGGVALRNVMAKLSQGRFMPKDVQADLAAAGIDVLKLSDKSLTLTDRLSMLKPVLSDSALLVKLFGLENANAATSLISGTDLMDQYNTAIQGANTAYEQAAVVMETTAEKMSRMKARVDDMKLSMFNLVGASYPYIDMMVQSMSLISDLVPTMMLMRDAILFVTNAEKLKAVWDGILTTKTMLVTAATWLWNAALAMNPIVLVVAGIAALVAILVVAWQKIDWFRGGVLAAWEALKQFGIILKDFVIDRIKGLLSGVAGIGSALVKLFKGDFAGAWETAKSAVGDLVGAGAVKKAIGSAKEAGKKIGAAYQEGVAQVKANKVETINAPANKIAPAMVPGIVVPRPNSPAANDNTIGGTTNSIASGGTRNTEIHINLRNLVENISFGGSLEESTDEMKRRVEQALLQVLNMAYASA